MDANQRSEANNQTNNGANEKGTPGSKGNTTSGPMDHTHPQGASRQQAPQLAGSEELPGGSMQSQQTGGSGAQQGISDSHQRQMEMHSEAWGLLEQPFSRKHRNDEFATDVVHHPANRQAAHGMNPQNPAHPELQGGGYGNRQAAAGGIDPSDDAVGASYGASHSTHEPSEGSSPGNPSRATGMPMTWPEDPNRSFQSGSGHPPQPGAGQSRQSGAGQSQQSTDRSGSQTGNEGRELGAEEIHQSNDVAGGLPRSPGNSGPRTEDQGYRPGGSMQQDPAIHESNDAAGGYPRSPGGANKLAGDKKMDDDTGFSRK
ncbi:hypothetical protein [Massilia niastensis]|uniref:hypothetical protein n=1 Tax=Massilia niastensis TaxID=544911 RepID=UPI00037FD4F8|nr:hypothetical protein [Massilia niastensis]